MSAIDAALGVFSAMARPTTARQRARSARARGLVPGAQAQRECQWWPI